MHLHEFLSEIGRSGALASQAARTHTEQHLESLFEKDEDGILHPIMVELMVAGKRVSVPKFVLVRSASLNLDMLEVEFETAVDLSSGGHDKHFESGPVPEVNITFKKGLFKRQTHMQVKASFRMGEPPEATEVIRDRLNEIIREKLGGND